MNSRLERLINRVLRSREKETPMNENEDKCFYCPYGVIYRHVSAYMDTSMNGTVINPRLCDVLNAAAAEVRKNTNKIVQVYLNDSDINDACEEMFKDTDIKKGDLEYDIHTNLDDIEVFGSENITPGHFLIGYFTGICADSIDNVKGLLCK